jgi:DNA-binding response OmpR family regulator
MPVPRTVLIVEDDPIIAAHLGMLLESNGYEVVGVADEFESALLTAEKYQPHVALVDVRVLGPIDGLTIGRELQMQHNTRLVFVTANLDVAMRGMTDVEAQFVGKPFSDQEVLAGLERAFSGLGAG